MWPVLGLRLGYVARVTRALTILVTPPLPDVTAVFLARSKSVTGVGPDCASVLSAGLTAFAGVVSNVLPEIILAGLRTVTGVVPNGLHAAPLTSLFTIAGLIPDAGGFLQFFTSLMPVTRIIPDFCGAIDACLVSLTARV